MATSGRQVASALPLGEIDRTKVSLSDHIGENAANGVEEG